MNDNYNKLLDDEYYKTVIYNTPNTVITNNSISNGYTVCDGDNLYDNFLNSLDKVKCKKLLMTHLPSKINIAKTLFDGYLTEEELQEKQYEGRFWDIYLGSFYILVDDDTLVIVNASGVEGIYGRESLPESLKGRHYYES